MTNPNNEGESRTSAESEEIEHTREFKEAEARLRYETRVQERAMAKEAKRKRDAERSAADIVDAVMNVDR